MFYVFDQVYDRSRKVITEIQTREVRDLLKHIMQAGPLGRDRVSEGVGIEVILGHQAERAS